MKTLFAHNKDSFKMLNLTWIAFFITFYLWFNHAPLGAVISETFNLTKAQWKAILILNVAFTIPARILIGILVDFFGPRKSYSTLLILSGIICIFFAFAQSYQQLAITRFLLGFTGAGFVIGIRLIGEWFPARNVGLAEGIYGGWGNFGSAAAAMTLPSLMLLFGGENGWRYSILTTAIISISYGIFYYIVARDTPKGSTYFKPKKAGGIEVSNKRDFIFVILTQIPLYLALALLVMKVSAPSVALLSKTFTYVLYLVLVVAFIIQIRSIYIVNKDMLKNGVPEFQQYKFSQVFILSLSYFITFGSELAVVSMLPMFFMTTFKISAVKAGLLASSFAFMNLLSRPAGGIISDKFGRKRSMVIFMIGLTIGYILMWGIKPTWSEWVAVAVVMTVSFFVQAGEGAVFSIVPLIQRRMTGQIAGLVGAFGNVGAVFFLTAYSYTTASNFFLIIGLFSFIGIILSLFLNSPKGWISEVNPDGTIEKIKVD